MMATASMSSDLSAIHDAGARHDSADSGAFRPVNGEADKVAQFRSTSAATTSTTPPAGPTAESGHRSTSRGTETPSGGNARSASPARQDASTTSPSNKRKRSDEPGDDLPNKVTVTGSENAPVVIKTSPETEAREIIHLISPDRSFRNDAESSQRGEAQDAADPYATDNPRPEKIRFTGLPFEGFKRSFPDTGSPDLETSSSEEESDGRPGQRHPEGRRPKRQFSHRTKTGCFTCRKRKKKCDEGKPDCQNCIKGKFTCWGYGTKPVGDMGSMRSTHPGIYPNTIRPPPEWPPQHGMSGPSEIRWQGQAHPPFPPERPPQVQYGPSGHQQPPPHPHPHQQGQGQQQGQGPRPNHPQHGPPHHSHPLPHTSAPPGPPTASSSSPLPPSIVHHGPPGPPPPAHSPRPPHAYRAPQHDARDPWQRPYNDPAHIHLQGNTLGPMDYTNLSMREYRPKDQQHGPPPQHHSQPPLPPQQQHESYLPHMQRGLPPPPPYGQHFGGREGSHMSGGRRGSHGPPMIENEREKMLVGLPYRHWKDGKLIADRLDCKTAVDLYNRAALPSEALSQDERANRFTAILNPGKRISAHGDAASIGRVGRCGERTIVEAPFYCDYGYNLIIGSETVIYSNCYIQDPCEIIIGNRCIVGPNVKLYGMTASIDVKNRSGSQGNFLGGSIQIEDDCWIGGDVTILPYRIIGKGATVAAGSVVTRNVKPYTIVAGNPAKEVRSLDESTIDRRMRTDIQQENEHMIEEMKRRRYLAGSEGGQSSRTM